MDRRAVVVERVVNVRPVLVAPRALHVRVLFGTLLGAKAPPVVAERGVKVLPVVRVRPREGAVVVRAVPRAAPSR